MKLIGQYQVTGRLGKGGFGEVLSAERIQADGGREKVAIKVLPLVEDRPTAATKIRSITNEARIGRQLKHTNIVRTLGFEQDRDGWYLILEYLQGSPVDFLLQDGPLPPRVALQMAEEICLGLEYAHRLKDRDGQPLELVHRDLKPSNLILTIGGVTKIMDFGIARSISNIGVPTASGILKGSPAYMSPEQVGAARDLGAASDIFSLGSVLYELLSGSKLFGSESLTQTWQRIRTEDVRPHLAPLDRVVPGVAELLAQALSKDPRARPGAGQMASSLAALRQNLSDGVDLKTYAAQRVRLFDESARVDELPDEQLRQKRQRALRYSGGSKLVDARSGEAARQQKRRTSALIVGVVVTLIIMAVLIGTLIIGAKS